jgi:NAD(P)H-hydrate epimerase
MKILTSAQMREVDRLSTEKYGIPSLFLMENAGAQVYHALEKKCHNLASGKIAIICGKGNNGGDGLVTARQLIMRGIRPDIYLLAKGGDVKGDAKVNLDMVHKMGIPVHEITEVAQWRSATNGLHRYPIIVDALLGTGITQAVSGLYEAAIQDINNSGAQVIAVDIPSGLRADYEEVVGAAVRADVTVTFTAPKIAHILGEAAQQVGELIIAPIGSPDELLASDEYYLNLVAREEAAREIPPRRFDAHKGTFGHILVVAGSRGKVGAAAMTGLAALRMGAGLVTVATAKSAQSALASYFVELMTEALEETDAGTISQSALGAVLNSLKEKDVLAIGPGLTTHPDTIAFVRKLVNQSPVPVLIDADGINAFVSNTEHLGNENQQPIVMTPHPGEMARLVNTTTKDVQNARVKLARTFAQSHKVHLVLKGYRTLVADPQGQVYVNTTGNPGMATAGSGDVLTGIIAALLVNRTKPKPKHYGRATAAAVYVHGLAGDLAAKIVGEESLIASDIIKFLPEAILALRNT